MNAQVGDVALAYELEGPAAAPVVVLSHCFGTHRGLWAAQVPALLAAGFRVLSYDVRGHGQSDAPEGPYSFDILADDVAGLLDALDLADVHYCGISMSGMIGQHLALRHPSRLRSLTLANTSSGYDAGQRAVWTERLTRIEADGVAAVHDVMMARWFTPESLAARPTGVDLMHEATLTYPVHLFVTIGRLIRDIATTDALPAIDLPTLIIAGALDPATTPAMGEVIHAQIKGSEFVLIDGAGHISPVERPQAFNEALLDFLARQEASR